jgi:hypothetical protein
MSDEKKIQSFIQYGLLAISSLEDDVDARLQLGKSKWIAHNPDETLPDSNLTTQQVADFNSLITAVNDLLSDHSAIIATLKSKNVPSHGTRCLD